MLDRKSFGAVAVAVCCGASVLGVSQMPAQAQTQAQAPVQGAAQAAPARVASAVARARPKKGTLIGQIRIKRMRLKAAVRQGVGQAILRRGVGHYPGTGLPGRDGNTVLLGHRTTWLHPFNKLDRMRRGDRIVLRVGRVTYVYKVRTKRVIRPRDMRVLEPVPFKRASAPNGQYITLITCTPKGSDAHRLVVVGTLQSKR
ncbi:class E sortase [Actinomadura geliboluensis]|uniref:class E sortase n=1 Tax=Actinomadura geliboluensis TaxID=882440 RepID=UPI0036963B34